MDKVYAPEDWKRLGEVLEARRGQLGYGFRQRERFLADRGGPPPSGKTLARLERGERTAYPPGTVTLLESLYELAPGSFEAFLSRRGDLEPLPLAPGPVPLRPVAPVLPATAASEAGAVLAPLLDRYSGDEVIAAIGAQRGKPPWMLTQEVLRWLEGHGGGAAARDVLAGLLDAHPDVEVVQVIGRQRHKRASMVTAEILEWLDWRPPEMEQGNGTAG